MNISVDGGGLCTFTDHRFGNFTLTRNLLKALYQFDKKNIYTWYTFCDLQSNMSSDTYHIKNLLPRIGWMKGRVSLEEMFRPNDVFLALNQALPLYTKAKKVVFSHGLSFMLYKELYKNDYLRLKQQLDKYVNLADIIITSSIKVTEELKDYYPQISKKIKTIPFGVPYEFQSYTEQKRTPFFLFSGMNHPIKQIKIIIKVFNTFIQQKQFAHYRLYLSGPFLDYASDSIIVISHQTAEELRNLYQTATAYLSTSLYESFNFPVLEALSQNCPVIALDTAVIPEMKPYVSVVTSEEELLDHMIKAAEKKLVTVPRQEIIELFSWKKYVERLVSYY